MREDIGVYQPRDLTERRTAASRCIGHLELGMPVVVDDVDDRVARAYGAWPDRLYVVDAGGRIAYQGGYGPFGFKPAEVAECLVDLVGPAGEVE